MQINLKENQQQINQMVEKFIAVAEDIKAVYEQSRKTDDFIQTKAYILTNLKIIYIEFQKNDAFLKCYPLNKGIAYQIERQTGKYLLDPENIINIKIRVSSDASIMFRFDSQPDR
ncbi:MAG: hypothetical protein U5N58_02860 [Actinomycetota bacterium]|nr:hypothetical protein [Actinomycetota bacterium]